MIKELDRKLSFQRLKKILADESYTEQTAYNPLMLAFEVTTVCNLHCIRCERRAIDPAHLNHHMTEETFERLSVLFPYVRGISIVGGLGEPLLAPNFWRFVRRMKSSGTQVQYFTNGTRWTADAMRKTLETGIDAVVFSMDGLSATTYERLKTGAQYDRSLDRINEFLNIRRETGGQTKLTLNCAVQRDTLAEMLPLLQFAADSGIDMVWYTGVITHRADEQKDSHLKLPLEQLREHFESVAAAAESLEVAIRLPAGQLKSRQLCLDLWTNLYVFYNGDVCACPHFREHKTYFFHVDGTRVVNEARELPDTILGNAHHVDVRTLWDGEKHRKMRARMLAGRPAPPCCEGHFSYDLH